MQKNSSNKTSQLANQLRKKMVAGPSDQQSAAANQPTLSQAAKTSEYPAGGEYNSDIHDQNEFEQVEEDCSINMFDQQSQESAQGRNQQTLNPHGSQMVKHQLDHDAYKSRTISTTIQNSNFKVAGDNRQQQCDVYQQQRQTHQSSQGSAQESAVPGRFAKDSLTAVAPGQGIKAMQNTFENFGARQPKGYKIKTTKFHNNFAPRGGPYAAQKGKGRKLTSFGTKKASLRGQNANLIYESHIPQQMAEPQPDYKSSIERINHWYNDRKESMSPEEPTNSNKHEQMLQHYQQHMSNQDDQHKFFRDISKGGYSLAHVTGTIKPQNLPKLPKNMGPMINVHQHFNQPNITNYNHNQYFLKGQENNDVQSSQVTSGSRKGAKSQDGMPGGQQALNKKKLNRKHVKSNVTETMQESEQNDHSNSKTLDARAPLPHIHEQSLLLENSGSKEHLHSDSHKLDFAIQNQTRQLNMQSMKQHLSPSQIYKEERHPYRSKRFKLESIRAAYNQYSQDPQSKTRLQADTHTFGFRKYSKGRKHEQSFRTIMNTNYEQAQREDLQDQLFLTKSQLNTANLELTKVKTRQAILQDHLKGKEKFIDELLKQTAANAAAAEMGYASAGPSKIDHHGYSSGEGSVDRLIGKGPYSVLRLKKKVQDYKELLAFKTAENEELTRNVKSLKVIELQKQLRIQDKQMARLRAVAQKAIHISKNNGLEDEITAKIDADDFALAFTKMSSSQQNLHKHIVMHSARRVNGKVSNRALLPVSGRESGAGMIRDASGEDQLENLNNLIAQLQNEKHELLLMDAKKGKEVGQLEQQVRTLKNQNAELTRKAADQSQTGALQENHKIKQLMEAVTQLTAEKSRVQRMLDEEKTSTSELKSQLKESSRTNSKVNTQPNHSTSEKDKQAIAQHQKEIKTLKSTINNNRSDYNAKLKKVEAENKASAEATKKQSEQQSSALSQKISVLQKEFSAMKKQLSEKEGIITELEKENNKYADAPQNNHLLAGAKHEGKRRGTEATKGSSKGLAMHRKAPSPGAGQKKPKAEEQSTHNLPSDSFVTNEQLKDEIDQIEQKMQNVDEKDFDERSDLQFSNMPSHVAGISRSQVSGEVPLSGAAAGRGCGYGYQELVAQSDRKKSTALHGMEQETIEEDVENEDADKSLAKQNDLLKQMMLDVKSMADQLPGAARGGLSASEVIVAHKHSIRGRSPTKAKDILNRLDKVPDESEKGSSHSGEGLRKKSRVREVKFVELTDPSVQLGFERLGRLLQFLKQPLDQMEAVVLEGKFRQDQSIKIVQLSQILQAKLAMETEQALEFARFLIEQKDEDAPSSETIVFDLDRQINSQYVPIRLMTFFDYYPAPYTEEETQKSKEKFTEAFVDKARGYFVKEMMTQEDAIVSCARFRDLIERHVTRKGHLSTKDIDCIYLMLLKGGQNDISNLSSAQLADKTRGFDSQTIDLLFPGVDVDDVTSVAASKRAQEELGESKLSSRKPESGRKDQGKPKLTTGEQDKEKALEQSSSPGPGVQASPNLSEKAQERQQNQGESAQTQLPDPKAATQASPANQDSKSKEKKAVTFNSNNNSIVPHEDSTIVPNPEKISQKNDDDNQSENYSDEFINQPKEVQNKQDHLLDIKPPNEDEIEIAKQQLSATQEKEDGKINNDEYGDGYYDEEDEGENKDEIQAAEPPQTGEEKEQKLDEQPLVQEEEKQEEPAKDMELPLEEEKPQDQEKEEQLIDEKEEEPKEEEKLKEEEQLKEKDQEEDKKDDDGKDSLIIQIESILERKIAEDNLQGKLTIKNRTNLVIAAHSIFEMFASSIKQFYPEMIDSCHDIFRDIIYTDVKVRQLSEAVRTRKSKEKNVEKLEVEVIHIEELIIKIETVIQQMEPTYKLSQGQQGSINIIYSSELRDHLILYDDIEATLKTKGIHDVKLTNSNMNYQDLDKKSIRILNRMIHWLGSSNTSFSEFMKDMIQLQEVKTKSGSSKVEIIHAKKFFQKLADNGIKKCATIHMKMCYFLCIDHKYKNYLLLKKLKRVIIDFNQSKYFQSIGLKKNKLTPNGGDFEYYDEEEPAKSSRYSNSIRSGFKGGSLPQLNNDFSLPSNLSHNSQNNKLLKSDLISKVGHMPMLNMNSKKEIESQPKLKSKSAKSAKSVKSRGKSNDDNGYEYYDEEDESKKALSKKSSVSRLQIIEKVSPSEILSPSFGQESAEPTVQKPVIQLDSIQSTTVIQLDPIQSTTVTTAPIQSTTVTTAPIQSTTATLAQVEQPTPKLQSPKQSLGDGNTLDKNEEEDFEYYDEEED